MGIRDRVDALLGRMATEPQFPTQGATLFIDLEREEVHGGYTPVEVVKTFLSGRGGNMFYLYNLVDTSLSPTDPGTPLIFGTGVLTGIMSSAARGNCSSWSPETSILMDSNCGDYFPSFMKLNGIDRLVIFGKPKDDGWRWLRVQEQTVEFHDASDWLGLNNIDLRDAVGAHLGGKWGKDLAMANITEAGEKGVLSSGIMGGPKAIWARGGTGAKMGAHHLKAIVIQGFDTKRGDGVDRAAIKETNKAVFKKYAATGVVKSALKVRGTPFLYKPSRVLGAMGTKNNQETTWTEALDAENLDPWRPKMAGCFRCGVNCRPMNDLKDDGHGDRYDAGDGPEYVTVGKFGPMIGVTDPKFVVRLNNIANDLGLDTASHGSSMAWAFELFERGIIDEELTGGLKLEWGNIELIEKLTFMTARREGFGNVLASSARAVDDGHYPKEALRYRMAIKGLMQSDPHDARILKAFALGLAVATRGMDHLRNRVTLEINARINDDPAFKERLYGGHVAAEPNSYDGKELAVRVCEDYYAVGDSVGMCRFTTKLFNSPSLPGLEEFAEQIRNTAGLDISVAELRQIGLNITGLERLLNARFGLTRKDDTVPERWFDEEITVGPYKGEKIDRDEFDQMLSRFYALSRLDEQGKPELEFHHELAQKLHGFSVLVKAPKNLPGVDTPGVVVTAPVKTVSEIQDEVAKSEPALGELLREGSFNVAINGDVLLHGVKDHPIESGDTIELMVAMAGG